MSTKQHQSRVTRLKLSRSVYTTITNKTAAEYQPRATEFYIRCKQLAGFWIRVNPSGRKVYGCYGRLFGVGKEARVTIGSTGLYSATQARKLATEHLQAIKAGIDPKSVAKTEADKKPTTIESLMEQYLLTNKDIFKPRYVYDFEYRLRKNFAALLRKNVRDLTTKDLQTWWLTKQGKRDPIGSKQVVLRYLSALLNFAKAFDQIEKNVAHDFKKITEDKKALRRGSPKKRHIKKGEMENWIASFLAQAVPHSQFKLEDGSWETAAAGNYPALWSNNPTISETQRDFLLFLLLTGKRLNESAQITWDDLDWNEDLPTITLQPEITKSSRQDVIPMTWIVGSMLKFRRDQRADKHKKWVFENKYGSGHIPGCRNSLEKICHYKGENFEIDLPETVNHHDLRRTYATMAEETGMSRMEVATLLSHSMGDVVDGYITRSLLQIRQKRTMIETEILQEARWYMLVNWYGCNADLMEHWDHGPQDERPKAGYLQRLQLPRHEQDEYRFE